MRQGVRVAQATLGATMGVAASTGTAAAAGDIHLEVRREGSLAATLTWTGGRGPYDLLIDPTNPGDEGYVKPGIGDTSITIPAEPNRGYCYQVFGSDGSISARVCL